MGADTIDNVLRTFGVTESEKEVYVFLVRHGVLNNREIARQMKKDRGLALRILKSLQSKGLVEATLELPTRYVVVPFERVIDLSIKTRRDEAAIIEGAKHELIDYWKQISKTVAEPSLEKFAVIEGERRIYAKVDQMIKTTKNQFLSTSTVADLVRGIKFDLFKEILEHSSKSEVQFRFITEVSSKNLNIVKSLLKTTLKKGIKIKGRNADLGLRPFPRMIIRDHEESMIFIESKTGTPDKQLDLCLWTNSSSIVNTFETLFEDLWQNSSDIRERIAEIETSGSVAKTYTISDSEAAKKKYEDVMESAREEIVVMTSSTGLSNMWNNIIQFREAAQKGVSIKIMAPIIRTNLESTLKFGECCQIRHVPPGYLATTVVDEQNLFQFKNPLSESRTLQGPSFENAFYTNDLEYVGKTKKLLVEVWEHAVIPSAITVEELTKPQITLTPPVPDDEYSVSREDSAHQKSVMNVVETPGAVTEEEVLNEIINAKRVRIEDSPRDVTRLYGSGASAVIHTPNSFNLPDIFLVFYHLNKRCPHGAEDWFIVQLWLETPKGKAFVPVAIVGDNPKGVEARKPFFAGTPAEQNSILLKKEQLTMQLHGNILFAGWTVPIPLYPPNFILPPASILFEGYGKLKSMIVETRVPSGAKLVMKANGFDAFVTFFHPASKYSGPGTDGVLSREIIMTCYPPVSQLGKIP